MTNQPIKPSAWALMYLGWLAGTITTVIANILITWALEPGGVPLWAAYVACVVMGVAAFKILYAKIRRYQTVTKKATENE